MIATLAPPGMSSSELATWAARQSPTPSMCVRCVADSHLKTFSTTSTGQLPIQARA